MEKGGGSVTSSASDALTDDLRREIALLKNRIEGLERDLMNQEVELKAAKVSLKDKNNDPMIKNLSALFQQFSLHLTDLQSVQKEMDKIFQLHKTTWDLKNLQTKLNLIENHQNMVSEEIYQSLHNRENNVKIEKDNNNNTTSTTITTPSTKVLKIDKTAAAAIQKQPVDIDRASKSVKIVENIIHSKASEQQSSAALQSGTNTLKRKREAKSPTKQATTVESSKKQQHDNQPTSPNQTIATILVSKTKTKSGLPLLLKNPWIVLRQVCTYKLIWFFNMFSGMNFVTGFFGEKLF